MSHPFLARPIDVFTCSNDPERRAIAMIRGFDNMIFRGSNTWKARESADTWRKEAVLNQKTLTKAQRAEIEKELAA